MTSLVLKGMAARKLRTALTAIAIVLGAAMVTGTLDRGPHRQGRLPRVVHARPTASPLPSSADTSPSATPTPTSAPRHPRSRPRSSQQVQQRPRRGSC